MTDDLRSTAPSSVDLFVKDCQRISFLNFLLRELVFDNNRIFFDLIDTCFNLVSRECVCVCFLILFEETPAAGAAGAIEIDIDRTYCVRSSGADGR